MNQSKNRRQAIKNIALGAAAIGSTTLAYGSPQDQPGKPKNSMLKGNINHSVCRWCYNDIPLETFVPQVKALGIQSIEITGPPDWAEVEKHGLTCAVATDFSFVSIENGFNDPANHPTLQSKYTELINQAADKGYPNVICFSGNRRDISDEKGLEQCAKGLDALVKLAERRNINLIMELLNSKVNHKDYQCDHTPWGVSLVEKMGSPNFKLLYDIYHMQIMEGDIIATINKYHSYIAHYHTGGVPGRHEINDSQELYYPAIMKAILETGYKGFVAQEFIPAMDDKIASLKEGITICDV